MQLLLMLNFEIKKAHVEKGTMTQWDHPNGNHVIDFLIISYHYWASPNADSREVYEQIEIVHQC